MNEFKYKAFLTELSQLTKKYRIQIGGCYCCGSPWLDEIDEKINLDKLTYQIKIDSEDHLRFEEFEDDEELLFGGDFKK